MKRAFAISMFTPSQYCKRAFDATEFRLGLHALGIRANMEPAAEISCMNQALGGPRPGISARKQDQSDVQQ